MHEFHQIQYRISPVITNLIFFSPLLSEETPLFYNRWYSLDPSWSNPEVEELVSTALFIRDKINEVLISEPPSNYDALVITNNSLFLDLQVKKN